MALSMWVEFVALGPIVISADRAVTASSVAEAVKVMRGAVISRTENVIGHFAICRRRI